jgi:hypothetical protein
MTTQWYNPADQNQNFHLPGCFRYQCTELGWIHNTVNEYYSVNYFYVLICQLSDVLSLTVNSRTLYRFNVFWLLLYTCGLWPCNGSVESEMKWIELNWINCYMCRSALTVSGTQLYWKACTMQLPWIIITRKDWSIGQTSLWMSSEEPLSMEREQLVCSTWHCYWQFMYNDQICNTGEEPELFNLY